MKRINLLLLSIFITALVSCTKSNPDVVLKSISFTTDSVTVMMGSHMQLSPVFTPTTFSVIPVEWATTNSSIVTVSPTGYVIASAPGKAWISIKDKNSATTGKIKFIVK